MVMTPEPLFMEINTTVAKTKSRMGVRLSPKTEVPDTFVDDNMCPTKS